MCFTSLCLTLLICLSTARPDPPYDVEFVNASHNSITITWKAGFDGGLVQSFRVRYKVDGTTQGYTYVDVQPPSATAFIVKGTVDMRFLYSLLSTLYIISQMKQFQNMPHFSHKGDGWFADKEVCKGSCSFQCSLLRQSLQTMTCIIWQAVHTTEPALL